MFNPFDPAPDGYFSHGLIVFNHLGRGGYVSKGFRLEFPDLRQASPAVLNQLQDQLRLFLRTVGAEHPRQFVWYSDPDYQPDLDRYDRETAKTQNAWVRRCRGERSQRYRALLARGEAPRLSASRLLGLIERAKAYPLLQVHHPQAVEGFVCVRPTLTTEHETFTVRVDAVYRSDREDALVFRLLLSSKNGREVRYRPQSFAIRVGSRVYPQMIVDAAGVIPPQGQVAAYFAVVGSPDGQRNELSPQNDFVILVDPLPAE